MDKFKFDDFTISASQKYANIAGKHIMYPQPTKIKKSL